MAVDLQRPFQQHPLDLLQKLPDPFSLNMSPDTSPKTVPRRHGVLPGLTSLERMSYSRHGLPAPSSPGPPPLTSPHQAFGSAILPPGQGPAPIRDPMASPGASDYPTLAAAQLSAARLHAQKRAYRQRRKDPSCDACRERKVKCDATETTSCSECASRNVKCQFTKETNRRMSSIKQVQDLERQLAHARQQLYHLRSTRNPGGATDSPLEMLSPVAFQPPRLDTRRRRPPARAAIPDCAQVQANLRTYAQGIFEPVVPPRDAAPSAWPERFPLLPSKDVADDLLEHFRDSIHSMFPIIHWPTFCHTYEAVCSRRGVHMAPSPSWGALLFSVLACGTLPGTRTSAGRLQDGRSYLQASRSLLDPLDGDPTPEGALTSLLISIFLFETNRRSSAWMWLGSCVRVCQSMGLHTENGYGSWPSVERRMRRRLWWSVYLWDRLLSIELGRPLQINDDDCEVDFPVNFHDEDTYDLGISFPTGPQATQSSFLFRMEVMQCLSQLAKAARSFGIDDDHALSALDAQFEACMGSLRPIQLTHSSQPLDPPLLIPLIYLQNARLALHRRNMSPVHPNEVRLAALDNCVLIAKGTVLFLSRMIPEPPSSTHPEGFPGPLVERMTPVASAMLCTHLWRCTLFLSFRGYLPEAQICARTSAAIGELRPVNSACGRHLAFFLGRLVEKVRRGPDHSLLGADEETLAYVSADLQGDMQQAWIWQGKEYGADYSPTDPRGAGPLQNVGDEPRRTELLGAATIASPAAAAAHSWGGWNEVLWLLETLSAEQGMRRDRTRGSVPGRSSAPPTVMAPPPPSTSATSSSRISIADII